VETVARVLYKCLYLLAGGLVFCSVSLMSYRLPMNPAPIEVPAKTQANVVPGNQAIVLSDIPRWYQKTFQGSVSCNDLSCVVVIPYGGLQSADPQLNIGDDPDLSACEDPGSLCVTSQGTRIWFHRHWNPRDGENIVNSRKPLTSD
jgi:hypothetical protein